MAGVQDTSHLIACAECDLLMDLPLQTNSDVSIHCPRCHHKIQVGHENPLDYVLALSITAIILLIMANSFPFLAFEAKGQGHSINLFRTAGEMINQGSPILGLIIFTCIVVLPSLYLLGLIALTARVKLGWSWQPPNWLARYIDALIPWAMAEVFLIGVLVALIKIVAMANIIFGVSFWAYIGFAVIFTYISGLMDTHRLWEWVETHTD